jgi:hypothetical protein
MPKNKISEYSSTAADNTDIGGINIAEGMAPSDVNNALREQMSQLKEFLDGSSGDTITTAKIVATTAEILSGADVTGTATFNSAVILSSTLESSGAVTFSDDVVLSGNGDFTVGIASSFTGNVDISGNLDISGEVTFAGNVDFQDVDVIRPTLLDYCVKGSALGSVGTLATVDMTAANFFSATLGSATTFVFSNPCGNGDFGGFVMELTNGGSDTVTWPTSVDWAGGSAPTLTSAGVDLLVFVTRDAGTTYHGAVASADSK